MSGRRGGRHLRVAPWCRSAVAPGRCGARSPSAWLTVAEWAPPRHTWMVKGKTVRSAASLEAAGSSACEAVAGVWVAGPLEFRAQSVFEPTTANRLSPWECRAAWSRQARREGAQEPSWGAAQGLLWPCGCTRRASSRAAPSACRYASPPGRGSTRPGSVRGRVGCGCGCGCG
jgi:hypothetical protein